MKPIKIEQVALCVPSIGKHIELMWMTMGLPAESWVHDTVTARGTVFGEPATNVAHLAFNHMMGYEFELIHYLQGNNWHQHTGRARTHGVAYTPFLSHMGFHTHDIEGEKARYLSYGWRIAQELWTVSHTNPYLIEVGRRFHYVVFDSRDTIGFDLKLIERIQS